jgi:uroporphyrinogen III methyltransferase/synthase
VKILVTQARGRSGVLAGRLRQAGFDVLERPLVRIEPLDGPAVPTAGYDWAIVTSGAAVEPLLRRAEGPLPPVAAIGPGTAAALRERGIEPALVASESTQEGLLTELPRPAGRVLFAGAEGARDLLVRELRADFVPLYRTVEETPEALPDSDLVVLASSSAARALAAVRLDLPCVSIGPVTSAEAKRLGLHVVSEAQRHDLDGLVEAVKLAASSIASSRS